jgi:hypothetical protein
MVWRSPLLCGESRDCMPRTGPVLLRDSARSVPSPTGSSAPTNHAGAFVRRRRQGPLRRRQSSSQLPTTSTTRAVASAGTPTRSRSWRSTRRMLTGSGQRKRSLCSVPALAAWEPSKRSHRTCIERRAGRDGTGSPTVLIAASRASSPACRCRDLLTQELLASTAVGSRLAARPLGGQRSWIPPRRPPAAERAAVRSTPREGHLLESFELTCGVVEEVRCSCARFVRRRIAPEDVNGAFEFGGQDKLA